VTGRGRSAKTYFAASWCWKHDGRRVRRPTDVLRLYRLFEAMLIPKYY